MTNSPVFEYVAAELEAVTGLSRLETRGTIRSVLGEVGLSPAAVMRRPMSFVLGRVLPKALAARGVAGAEEKCAIVARALESADLGAAAAAHEDPEDVFSRFGGDAHEIRRPPRK